MTSTPRRPRPDVDYGHIAAVSPVVRASGPAAEESHRDDPITPDHDWLPVYNGERFLGEALDSILAQTFPDFVLSFRTTPPRIDGRDSAGLRPPRRTGGLRRSPEERGAAWNFNRVFAECHSPYFKWAAADDMLAPTCLERCIETLRAAPPAVALVYPRTTMIGPDGEVVGEVDNQLDARESSPYRRLHHVVMNMVYGNVLFAVMRSDTLRRTSGHGAFPSGGTSSCSQSSRSSASSGSCPNGSSCGASTRACRARRTSRPTHSPPGSIRRRAGTEASSGGCCASTWRWSGARRTRPARGSCWRRRCSRPGCAATTRLERQSARQDRGRDRP